MPVKPPSRRQKEFVEKRARWQCEYCRCPASFSPFTFHVDHILPYSEGGQTELENLAFSCGCNSFKVNRTHARNPQTGKLAPLFHPRLQQWSDHFAWSEDTLQIIGRTPTGRATVTALRLNRKELVNLRELLLAVGLHPPTD
ncbi:MAG TPA: HNH endonuclease signature motif containing protein [Blastocatellia bacterium]|nr:HNH endonuclease signature motif containing protein [Blastocatellia bacterium]HMX29885.1 HNH endonuclease signature motif containing protein [Blastocatellia bacterium]HMY72780.1 HNH endonuclease signature motif containing protein [Blastocatellia bacterium]HMZ20729.1 HNH endonuclease signature motif containing protein [Blastocatellia bacterium]HNG34737.1 HNH endonuclease signature motif containing protein [Blastocatellia bacterium]